MRKEYIWKEKGKYLEGGRESVLREEGKYFEGGSKVS